MSDQGDFTAPFPLQAAPFVDSRGIITLPWLMFLQQIQRRTGGDVGPTPGADVDFVLSLETTEALWGQGLQPSDVLAQEISSPNLSLGDMVRDILTGEMPPPAAPVADSALAQEITQVLAPVVADIVREVLARELTLAQGSTQQPLPEMTFAPTQSTAFARAPVQVVATSSPVTLVARGPYSTLSIDGGTITNITVNRGTWSRTVGNTTPFIAMSPGDTVTITYLAAPTLYFLPRI